MARHDRTVTTLILAAVVAACEDSPSTPALNTDDIGDVACKRSPGRGNAGRTLRVSGAGLRHRCRTGRQHPDRRRHNDQGDPQGQIGELNDVPTLPGMGVNGITAIGRRNLFVTTESPDLARGAGVWQVSQGRVRLIGDIEAFESAKDPAAFA